METVPVDARNAPYNPMKPLVKSVKYADRLRPQFRPVWDINDSAAFHKPTFSKTYGKRSTLPIEPSATVLVESFFPDSLLEEMAMKTNQYAASLLPQSKRIEIRPADICYFLAMYYYMGIAKLPSKTDYWRSDHNFWPIHPVAQNISRDKFAYIWRYGDGWQRKQNVGQLS